MKKLNAYLSSFILIFALALSVVPAKVHALDTDKAAHLGIAYTLNTSLYGFYKKGLRMNRFVAFVFAAFVTGAACAVKEYMDPTIDGGDLAYDLAGMGLSGFTVFAFDF